MKISKEYLKQVIKEEINRLIENQQLNDTSSVKQTEIQMSPIDFLKLTTHRIHFPLEDIKKRYNYRLNALKNELEKQGIDSAISDNIAKEKMATKLESLRMPDLIINEDAKVTNHEGRLRSYYYGFIKQPKSEKIAVLLIYPATLNTSNKFLTLKNQFDDDETPVIIKNPVYSEKKENIFELDDLITGDIENKEFKKDDLSIGLRKLATSMKDAKQPLLAIEKLNNILSTYYVVKKYDEKYQYNIQLESTGLYGSAKYKKLAGAPDLLWNDIVILRKK